ncbi:hypothetical protein AB990_16535 [Alkalihalobacillus pseudalcaliphilus]|nr:hypothetical protein AB990_16535 [Alkalihalobacillus pseudalcaliphilus]
MVIGLVLFWGAGYFVFAQQPKEFPPFVSESPSPSGTKALYTYFDGQELEVERWEHAPIHLQGENQVMLMIEPAYMLSREEMEQYIRFVEAGNTLIFMSHYPTEYFGLATDIAAVELSEEPVEVTTADGELKEGIVSTPLRLIVDDTNHLLVEDEWGPIATEQQLGEGSLIVTVTPEWLMNHFILDGDHLELVLSLMNEHMDAGTTVLIDEFVHNPDQIDSYYELYPFWFQLLFVQLILLTIFILWVQGKRFGPIESVREETVRFSYESLRALAAWHLRSKQYKSGLQIQADFLKVRIQERFGISSSHTLNEIADGLTARFSHQFNEKEIHRFMEGLQRVLAKPEVSKQEFLQWSKRIEHFRKEVEQG